MPGRHVQVIAPGAALEPVAASGAEIVVCADGGVGVALAAGRAIDRVVGDLDSASSADLDAARSGGARIDRHPEAKDESDLELALAAALTEGAAAITVHLAAGGRLDHQLANLLVLASTRWRAAAVDAWIGDDRVWVAHDTVLVPIPIGGHLALQAVGGPARVTSRGVAFPLDAEVLHPSQARGISNSVTESPAEVHVDEGVVLVLSSAEAT